jgi:uncharacterized protein (TIGR00266 family)
MASFQILPSQDPALIVDLAPHEEVIAESDAMVSMDASLSLSGSMNGGLLSSLGRKLLNNESFFQQKITADRTGGRVLLAPTLPGGIGVIPLHEHPAILLNDGAFLACDGRVKVQNVTQSLGRAFFGGTGGFFIMEASHQGPSPAYLAISGFGSIVSQLVEPGKDLLVDNVHVVAWERHLKYEVSVSTTKKGMLSSLVNSVTSGEGVVNRFYGQKPGVVWISTRNRANFVQWIQTFSSNRRA